MIAAVSANDALVTGSLPRRATVRVVLEVSPIMTASLDAKRPTILTEIHVVTSVWRMAFRKLRCITLWIISVLSGLISLVGSASVCVENGLLGIPSINRRSQAMYLGRQVSFSGVIWPSFNGDTALLNQSTSRFLREFPSTSNVSFCHRNGKVRPGKCQSGVSP